METFRSERLPISLTPYDVLGYIVPGSTLLVSISLFETWASRLPTTDVRPGSTLHVPLLTTLNLVHTQIAPSDWLLLTIFGLGLLLLAYITGHLVSAVSSLAIDRVLVFKGYGYPYRQMLFPDAPPASWEKTSRAFYRGLFFWFNVYVFFRYVAVEFGRTDQIAHPGAVAASIGVVLSEWFLVTAILAKLGFGMYQRHEKGVGKDRPVSNALALRVRADLAWFIEVPFAKPYDGLSATLAWTINTRRSFDDSFRARYLEQFERRFNLSAEHAGTNNFWLSYCFVLERSPRLAERAGNWLTLYGFARNLACAFYLAFFYAFTWLLVQGGAIVQWHDAAVVVLVCLPLGLLALAMILLVRYYHLYVCYFNKFIFRAFVFLTEMERSHSALGSATANG